MISGSTKNVLIYSIHNTDHWWRHVGRNMGFDNSYVVSDLRGEGDFCVVDDFYKYQRAFYKTGTDHSDLLDAEEVSEIIARCRVLRFMPLRTARAMVLGMAAAFSSVLDQTAPSVIVAFPIDRYVSDVLEHLGRARGIPFYELTVSPLPGMSMFLKKGVLRKRDEAPDPDQITHYVNELATPLFTPSYVQGLRNFNMRRFMSVFLYFRMRALAFLLISWRKRDPLNLHYLDSQSFLGHKPTLSDWRVTRMVDVDWRNKLDRFAPEKRVFFGLQLFPEASIDYWIPDLELIKHEDLLVDAATAFSEAGYLVLVKDHPLQFGFRQRGLIERLLKLSNVVFVPYEVSGNEVLSKCGVNFTCTGTLGLQAGLLGLKSITTKSYYYTPSDFILLDSRKSVADLPARVEATPVADLGARQRRIIANLLRGSFKSDFFSFQNFDPAAPSRGATDMGRLAGEEIRLLLSQNSP